MGLVSWWATSLGKWTPPLILTDLDLPLCWKPAITPGKQDPRNFCLLYLHSSLSCHAVSELGKKDLNQRPSTLSGIQVLREAYDRKEEDSGGQMPICGYMEASEGGYSTRSLSLILCLRIKNIKGTTVKPSWLRSMRCAGYSTRSTHTRPLAMGPCSSQCTSLCSSPLQNNTSGTYMGC